MARATVVAGTPGVTFVAAQVNAANAAPLTTRVTFVPVASSLALTVAPLTSVGAAAPTTVTVLDSSLQRVAYYQGTIHFSSSDPLAVLPAPYPYTTDDAGQHTFPAVVFNTLGTQSLTVVDAADANIMATQGNIQVSRVTIPHFVVSGVLDGLAGTRNQITLTVLSDANQIVTSYAGTVHVSSSDPNALLPPNAVVGPADAGVKTLPVTLTTAGRQSVTVADLRDFSVNGTQANIYVGVFADRLAVLPTAPAVTAGSPTQVSVRAVDAYRNADANYQGAVTVTGSDPLATLPAAYTLTGQDAGVYTFSMVPRTAGTQTVAVSGVRGLSGSSSLVVNAAGAAGLEITVPPTAQAGVALGAVVTARDPFHNVATGYTAQVTLSSSDAHATLPEAHTFVPAEQGQVTLAGIALNTSGNQTLTITDATNNFATSSTTIVVSAAQVANFIVAGITGGIAGHSSTAQVTATDRFGNPVPSYTGTVHVSSTDPNAVLPADYTFTLADAGRHTFASVALSTAGTQAVRVCDASVAAISGLQTGIVISPGSASHFFVATSPNATAGQSQNVVLTALDPYGNVDPNFTDQVILSSSDLMATVPASRTYAGSTTLHVTFFTGGTQSLTATSQRGVVGSQQGIVVASSGATRLLVFGVVDGLAGQTRTVSVQAVDEFNNLVPSYRGVVRFSSSDPRATLPRDARLRRQRCGTGRAALRVYHRWVANHHRHRHRIAQHQRYAGPYCRDGAGKSPAGDHADARDCWHTVCAHRGGGGCLR